MDSSASSAAVDSKGDTIAHSHDARLAEFVAELGGDEVRFSFRDLVEKALQELIDAELIEAIGAERTNEPRS